MTNNKKQTRNYVTKVYHQKITKRSDWHLDITRKTVLKNEIYIFVSLYSIICFKKYLTWNKQIKYNIIDLKLNDIWCTIKMKQEIIFFKTINLFLNYPL